MDDNKEEDQITMVPSEVIIHKDWNPEAIRFNDDIALLILESEIVYTKFIRPICLMTNYKKGISETGIVAGWGTSGVGGKQYENIPKKLEIPIVESNGKCYRENTGLAEIGSEKSFCAGRPGVGVCLGDSGSGFMIKVNNKFYFKGIVSSSITTVTGCYTKDYAIYTDVSKYYEFIQNPKGSTEKLCGVMSSATSLVAGGKNSTQEQFPWVVSTLIKGENGFGHYGSGSLVTNRHVVTTGDAVGYGKGSPRYRYAAKSREIRLYIGSTKYESADEPGAIYISSVKNVAVYPESTYGNPAVHNIAVVSMLAPVIFSRYIHPVCLWHFGVSVDDQVGQIAYGVGFGHDEDKKLTEIKKHVPMTIDSMDRCKTFYNDYLELGDYFCASGQEGNIALKYDDSLYLKRNGRWYLRGLNAFQPTDNENPVLYENIASFINWLVIEIKAQ